MKDYIIITEKFYIGDIVVKLIHNYLKEYPESDLNCYVFKKSQRY
ncbi:hypothetical protein CTK_P00070 (plasmid) [Clostridium tyrobutyricum]|nr:hypothetical protein CTK_P00070 [Clostridium tyrobutyricum]